MILRRLRVTNFGCLGDGEWAFAEGANLVVGRNEAGKSTLAEAVALALLSPYPVKGEDRKAAALRTWGREEMFRLEAEFCHAGAEWRVVRDYAQGQSSLRDLTGGEEIRDDTRIRARLGQMAGLIAGNTRDQYLATAYLRQGEWDQVGKVNGITDLLAQALATTVAGPAAGAIKALTAERDDHNRGVIGTAPKNPGPVARAAARLSQLRDRRSSDAGEARARAEEQAGRDLLEARGELQRIGAALHGKRPRLAAAERRREVEKRLAEAARVADDLADRVAKARPLADHIRDLDGSLRRRLAITREDVQTLANDLEKARGLEAQAESSRAEQSEAQAKAVEAEAAAAAPAQTGLAPPTAPGPHWGGLALGVVGAVLVVAAIGLSGHGAALSLSLGICGVALGAAAAYMAMRRRETDVRRRGDAEADAAAHRATAQAHREAAKGAARREQALRAEAAALRKAVADRLEGWGVADLARAKEHAEESAAMRSERDSDARAVGLLLGEQALEELERALVDAQSARGAVQRELEQPELAAAAMDDAGREALRREVTDLEDEVRGWESKETRAEALHDTSRGAGEDLLALDEEIVAAEAELARVERRRQVLVRAVEWLEQAQAQVRSAAHEVIVPRASAMTAALTAGRHPGLAVGASLAPAVDAPAKGASASPAELSYATREQVYLALRLALCEALWPAEGPPLILDEPLLAFDAERKAAAVELLRELSGRRQIIILTCTADYDGLAATRIEL